MSTKWIEHRGHEIFLMDFSGLDEPAYLAAMEEAGKEIGAFDAGNINAIVDLRDTTTTTKVTMRAKELFEFDNERSIIALVGITGVKKVIARMVRRDLYYAADMDDAKDWVATQADLKRKG